MNENIIGWSIVGVLLIVAILVKRYCDRQLAKQEKEIDQAMAGLKSALESLHQTLKNS
jgi:hypothetical protein